jgi:hypothetical protein
MVGVAGEDQIDAGFRQQRVIRFREDGCDVIGAIFLGPFGDQFVGASINVDGVNFAVRANCFGEMESKIAAAGAKVGDLRTRRDLKRSDYLVRLLPLVAVDALVSPLVELGAASV